MEINRKEMGKFFWVGINGLCKICNLPTPSALGMQEFNLAAFKEVDQDGGGTVDFYEFKEWISNNGVIQDFLLKHTG